MLVKLLDSGGWYHDAAGDGDGHEGYDGDDNALDCVVEVHDDDDGVAIDDDGDNNYEVVH